MHPFRLILLKDPMYDMLLSVRAKGEGGNGFYGLLCHYKDDNNYYRAGIPTAAIIPSASWSITSLP